MKMVNTDGRVVEVVVGADGYESRASCPECPTAYSCYAAIACYGQD